jgi:hypothetical protein
VGGKGRWGESETGRKEGKGRYGEKGFLKFLLSIDHQCKPGLNSAKRIKLLFGECGILVKSSI